MQTSWIVQTNVERESTSPALLRSACSSLGLPFHSVSVIAGSRSLPELPFIDGPVVFHGRNTLIQCALQDERWRAGVFFSEERFTHEAYVAALGSDKLNAAARTVSLDELLASDYPPMNVCSFAPMPIPSALAGKLSAFRIARSSSRISDAPCRPISKSSSLSEVLEVDAEWRLFFVAGRMISGSMYRPSGESLVPLELIEFAEAAAQRWLPAGVVVMDVARHRGTWKIIEFNCFNGSRFYLANVEAIVSAVSRFQAERR